PQTAADEKSSDRTPSASPATAKDTKDSDSEPVTRVIDLKHDLRLDVAVTGGLASVTIAFRLVRDDLEPTHCRICDPATLGKVNAIDDWFLTALKRPDINPANYTSYILAFGVAPVSGAGLTALAAIVDRRSNEALIDILAVAEGGFSAMLTTEILESIS